MCSEGKIKFTGIKRALVHPLLCGNAAWRHWQFH